MCVVICCLLRASASLAHSHDASNSCTRIFSHVYRSQPLLLLRRTPLKHQSLHLNLSLCTLVHSSQAFPTSLRQNLACWFLIPRLLRRGNFAQDRFSTFVSHMFQHGLLSTLLSSCTPCMKMYCSFILAKAISCTATFLRLQSWVYPFAVWTIADISFRQSTPTPKKCIAQSVAGLDHFKADRVAPRRHGW